MNFTTNKLFIYLGLFIIILSIIFFIHNNIKQNKKADVQNDYLSYVYNKALNYEEAKNFSKAIELYSKLIKFDSTKGDFYFNRGYCYIQISKKELSIQDYNKSVALKYRLSDSYFNLGLIYMCSFNDSLAYFNFALAYQYNPHNADAKSNKEFFEKIIKQKH